MATLNKLNLEGFNLGIQATSQAQAEAWAIKILLQGTSPQMGLDAQLSHHHCKRMENWFAFCMTGSNSLLYLVPKQISNTDLLL